MTQQTLGIITLFPEMFTALQYGVVGRAINNEHVRIHTYNPRDYSADPHRRVDDRPYGGGPGMVMMAEPLAAAINAAKQEIAAPKVIYLSPQGKRIDQALLQAHTHVPLLFIAGRYEGIDQRLIDTSVDEQWSIGDYVLSGGEFAAMVIIDGITRLLPGVLGHEDSASQDSFTNGLLDCPHYTRPEVYDGQHVPQVLLSGDHKAIEQWRNRQALANTKASRPDLLASRQWSSEELTLLEQQTHRGE